MGQVPTHDRIEHASPVRMQAEGALQGSDNDGRGGRFETSQAGRLTPQATSTTTRPFTSPAMRARAASAAPSRGTVVVMRSRVSRSSSAARRR